MDDVDVRVEIEPRPRSRRRPGRPAQTLAEARKAQKAVLDEAPEPGEGIGVSVTVTLMITIALTAESIRSHAVSTLDIRSCCVLVIRV